MFPIRAVEDDHVDRRRVDVQQCMKLSLTNSPIGLIVLIDHAHHALKRRGDDAVSCPDADASFGCSAADGPRHEARRPLGLYGCHKHLSRPSRNKSTCKKTSFSKTHRRGKRRWIALSRPGGHGGAAAPVPIPNTAVKRPSANGTSS